MTHDEETIPALSVLALPAVLSPLTKPFAQNLKSNTVCPTPDTDYRTGARVPYWPKGATIYYSLDPSVGSDLASAAKSAMSSWTSANRSDGSNVSFVALPVGAAADLIWKQGEVTTGPGSTNFAGQFDPNDLHIFGTVTITIDAGNLGGTWFDPHGVAPNLYQQQLYKACLHELGHTMGLGDQTATDGFTCGNETPAVL